MPALTPSVELLLGAAVVGAAVGMLSGAFGKGGSAVATPLLHVIGVPAIVAIASPLPATIPSTLLAARQYGHAGEVEGRLLRLGIAVGVPLTAAGALATRWIPAGPLVLASELLVVALGVKVLAGSAAHARPSAPTWSTGRSVLVVAAVGVVSGLLGNSGGFLLAPLFISVLGLEVHRALGTSLALSAFLAIPGTVVHALLGHIDWSLTMAFACGSVPFASLGAALALRIRVRALTIAYGSGLAVLGVGLLAIAH